MKNGMTNMNTRRIAALGGALLLIGSGLTGCVSTERYNNVEEANRRLTTRNQELVAQNEQLSATNAQLSNNGSATRGTVGELMAANQDLKNRLDNANAILARFNDRLGDLNFGALDPATDAALAQLAADNPGLLTYDADRGMIRFSSDLTFASGSDQVKSEAVTAISQLASVLTSSSGGQYEMHIVGHTDSQPIGNPATRRSHPTNMHLAAHRAIAVRGTLRGQGVPASRMSIGGWGEHRPAVANNANSGTPANRRVEIFLRPATGTTPAAQTPAASEGATTRAPAVGAEPTK